MPLYDYKCKCGHVQEIMRPATDKKKIECPECGKIMKRIWSGSLSLNFKGSGFHCNDYPTQV